MIRTQLYIPESIHSQLLQLAKATSSSMAEITREFIKDGLKNTKDIDRTGQSVMRRLLNLNLRGGPKDLSTNLDHYLYGGPKKKI